MKPDSTIPSTRPSRHDGRTAHKTRTRTIACTADFPTIRLDSCKTASRSSVGTLFPYRTGSVRPLRGICALLLLTASLPGCDDIFEQKLDGARIEVIAPKPGTHVEAGEVTFLWRPLQGARRYRLTVVSPNFARASHVAVDTTLCVDSLHRADRCSLTLGEGDYQWSLQAFNGVYRSEESVYSLRVDPAPEEGSQPPSGGEESEHDEENSTPPSDEPEGNNSPDNDGNSAPDDTNEPADGSDTSEP